MRWREVAAFDNKLLSIGSWDGEIKDKFLNWINELDFNIKKRKASKLLSELILNFLREDCSEGTLKKIKRLGEQLFNFEEIIITTKSGIERKFYRDHLNHMLRVALLTKAISENLTCMSLSKRQRNLLTLVGLLHDIAYPLAETYRIIKATTDIITECYSTLIFPPTIRPNYDLKALLESLKLIDPKREIGKFLFQYLEDFNHGFIGAIEFLQYVAKEEVVVDEDILLAAQAIALHDKDFEIKIDSKNPLFFLLLLCDELQDWGRPVGLGSDPLITRIDDFHVLPCGLKATMDFSRLKIPEFLPLKSIYNKLKNIKRLEFNPKFKLELSFKLPNYIPFDISKIKETLTEYFSSDNYKNLENSYDLKKDLNKYYQRWLHKFEYPSVKRIQLKQLEDSVRYLLSDSAGTTLLDSINLLFFDWNKSETLIVPKFIWPVEKERISVIRILKKIEKTNVHIALIYNNNEIQPELLLHDEKDLCSSSNSYSLIRSCRDTISYVNFILYVNELLSSISEKPTFAQELYDLSDIIARVDQLSILWKNINNILRSNFYSCEKI